MSGSIEDTQLADEDATAASATLRSREGLVGTLERGASVGRYLVLGELGAGAMGVVYDAYDPELDRKVALKLVLPSPGGSGTEEDTGRDMERRARLLREAQALAKLAHPNVVGVHDVGTVGNRVWIAMEFVDGQTLGAWASAQQRPWRRIVEVMREAGRGLAAAHGAGLLHRDFKPDNVMVGSDGRVRVMDFGLARARGDGEGAAADESDADGTKPDAIETASGALGLHMTRAGQLIGTPAYMAPEQFEAQPATARSDQFAFCVTLWEALYGERPFAGATLMELMTAVLEGRVRSPPTGRRVPSWLRKLCLRGLEVDPDRRFGSIDALLEAIDQGTRGARRRRMALGACAVAALAGGVVGAKAWDEQATVRGCELEAARVDEIWNGDVRDRLRDGLLATDLSYAQQTAERAIPYFDRQAAAIRDAQIQACLDARVHGTRDEALLTQATACLDDRRMQLDALATELSAADAGVLRRAVGAAARLSPTDACLDPVRLGRAPSPPKDAVAVEAVRRQLSRARALRSAGKYPDALDVAESGLSSATTLGWSPLTAEAREAVGSLLHDTGKNQEAEATLEQAYFDAVEAGELDAAARAATTLTFVVGRSLARADDGRRWGRHANAVLDSLGEPEDGPRAVSLRAKLAGVDYSAGDYDSAKTLTEENLVIFERTLGPDHPSLASALVTLGGLAWATGDYEGALQLFERTLALRERAVGPDHPDVASALNNIGNVYWVMGQYERAVSFNERALAIREKALGPDHPQVADSMSNLANNLKAMGSLAEARALHEKALEVRTRVLGPDHPDVAGTLTSLATLHGLSGDFERARDMHERALDIYERALGSDHEHVAMAAGNLGNTYRSLGRFDEALARYERSIATYESTLGSDHPDLAYPLHGLAETMLESGRPANGIASAERAVALRTEASIPPELAAESKFLLAQLLWEAPAGPARDRPRARSLASQALDDYRKSESQTEPIAEVERWLSENGSDATVAQTPMRPK